MDDTIIKETVKKAYLLACRPVRWVIKNRRLHLMMKPSTVFCCQKDKF